MIALNLRPTLQLTDAVFEQLCQQNPDLRLERTAQGDLIAMSPAGSERGRQNLSLSAQLWHWNQQVYCYRPRQPVQLLNQPSRLSGETLLPNFVMDLTLIWQ